MLFAFLNGPLLLKKLLSGKLNRGQYQYEACRWDSCLQSEFLDTVIEMVYETNPHLLLERLRSPGGQCLNLRTKQLSNGNFT